jgi:hypothetical protein
MLPMMKETDPFARGELLPQFLVNLIRRIWQSIWIAILLCAGEKRDILLLLLLHRVKFISM